MTSSDAFTWLPLAISLAALVVAFVLGGKQ